MTGIDRRTFLALGGSSLAAALLGACDSMGPREAKGILRWAERRNEAVERILFRHTAMDTPESRMLAGRALPSYFISPRVPWWDASARGPWTLEVTGLVRRPLKLTLEQLMRLPRVTQRVNHYCVEGWMAVTQWTGVRVSTLARMAGLRPEAKYADFESFDSGYHESWDLESALHRQTVVAYGWDGGMLTAAHGAPARLHSPVKLGYKNVKYLTKIVFLPKRNGGYWSDRGYEWYAGT
jgi:DMSO/TMAO reductase YedYZ molybdopterin-dependent catalytic subunit